MNNRPFSLLASTGVCALFFTGSAATAQAPNADVKSLFSKVAAAYRGFRSISMNIETISPGRTAKEKQIIKTRLVLVKPDRVSADVTSSIGNMHMVADGKSVFAATTKDPTKYLKQPISGFPDLVRSLQSTGGCGIGLLSILLIDPAAETKLVPGEPVSVLRGANLTISGEVCDVVNVQSRVNRQILSTSYVFAKSDHFLRRITISNSGAGAPAATFVENYTETKVNPTVSASLFRFVPRSGAVAVDPSAGQQQPYSAKIRVGAAPIPITGSDLSGQPVSLAQYKGKVLLLDFWATWCGPCVAELPNVVAAYGKYHSRGFEVVGITLDTENSKQKVASFTVANKMPWRQIYDGKYWSAANAVAYGIQAIPFTMLIGRDGKIAAVGATGAALAPAIEAALGRK